jgi:phosphatidate cytidylyltransferase
MATTPLAEKSEASAGSTLTRRIITGLICAACYPAIALLPLGHGLPFALGVAIFSVIGSSEFYGAVRRQGAEPTSVLGYIACILFNLVAWRRDGNLIDPFLPALLVLLVIVGLLVEVARRRNHPTANLGTTLLGAIYVGWLSSFVTLLRGTDTHLFTNHPIAGTTVGAWLVIYVSLMTWGADTAALFTGRAFGKHKLAPFISPNKTWEGSMGGVLVSSIIGIAGAKLFGFPVVHGVALGVLIGVFGLVGDLCASVMKRDLGVKDFGGFLPGHGGVLDRIDSLILAAPVAYYYISVITYVR